MQVKFVLPVIVISQFFCVSLWFAGNAIFPDLASSLQLGPGFLAQITSIVQFGFIAGTFFFALFAVSDRFSPSRVFFISSILAAITNLGICIPHLHTTGIFVCRFLTGFFLAGIYPVGMKIASDYYQKGLGRSLGFLVGALVLGTAFPHLLKNFTSGFAWQNVMYMTSALSVTGGILVVTLIPDGPYRSGAQKLKLNALFENFRQKNFRSVAFGYFGHMWELYTFWAFVPVMLAIFENANPEIDLNISFLSFLIIGSGSIACVAGGIISQYASVKRTATIALFLSFLCCLLSPLFLTGNNLPLFLVFMFFWAIVVIADSPLFSTLVAQHAAEASRGTSLTIVNCIGFSITILSIQFIELISREMNPAYLYLFLAIGPAIGLIALINKQSAPIQSA